MSSTTHSSLLAKQLRIQQVPNSYLWLRVCLLQSVPPSVPWHYRGHNQVPTYVITCFTLLHFGISRACISDLTLVTMCHHLLHSFRKFSSLLEVCWKSPSPSHQLPVCPSWHFCVHVTLWASLLHKNLSAFSHPPVGCACIERTITHWWFPLPFFSEHPRQPISVRPASLLPVPVSEMT